MITKKASLILTAFAFFMFLLTSCGGGEKTENETETTSENNTETVETPSDPMENKGIGPVKEDLNLPASIDETMAAKGQELFTVKCSACHETTANKKVGPGLLSVTERRTPEWIMNMILNPSEMLQKDPIAKELLATYLTQMANQNLTMDEARSVLEYFRSVDSK